MLLLSQKKERKKTTISRSLTPLKLSREPGYNLAKLAVAVEKNSQNTGFVNARRSKVSNPEKSLR